MCQQNILPTIPGIHNDDYDSEVEEQEESVVSLDIILASMILANYGFSFRTSEDGTTYVMTISEWFEYFIHPRFNEATIANLSRSTEMLEYLDNLVQIVNSV